MGGWVYMMTNRRDGTLYVGVCGDLPRRAYQHREGLIEGFTKRYGLKMLIYYEQHDVIRNAIQREKTIKHWPRAWKMRLIHSMNPEWEDLYEVVLTLHASCPALCRPSTLSSFFGATDQDVDGRDEPGHDGVGRPRRNG